MGIVTRSMVRREIPTIPDTVKSMAQMRAIKVRIFNSRLFVAESDDSLKDVVLRSPSGWSLWVLLCLFAANIRQTTLLTTNDVTSAMTRDVMRKMCSPTEALQISANRDGSVCIRSSPTRLASKDRDSMTKRSARNKPPNVRMFLVLKRCVTLRQTYLWSNEEDNCNSQVSP